MHYIRNDIKRLLRKRASHWPNFTNNTTILLDISNQLSVHVDFYVIDISIETSL